MNGVRPEGLTLYSADRSTNIINWSVFNTIDNTYSHMLECHPATPGRLSRGLPSRATLPGLWVLGCAGLHPSLAPIASDWSGWAS